MIIDIGPIGGGGSSAGVSSLNGQTGDLTLKTVNNNTLLGTGNIEISGGGDTAATVNSAVTAANAYTDSAITNAVSGIPTEFKTINGSAITGSGNIEIEGGAEVNYQIVNNLSAVTDEQEGTKVFVKSYDKTITGGCFNTENVSQGWVAIHMWLNGNWTDQTFYWDGNDIKSIDWQTVEDEWMQLTYGMAYAVSASTGYTLYFAPKEGLTFADSQEFNIVSLSQDMPKPVHVSSEEYTYDGSNMVKDTFNIDEMTTAELAALYTAIKADKNFMRTHNVYHYYANWRMSIRFTIAEITDDAVYFYTSKNVDYGVKFSLRSDGSFSRDEQTIGVRNNAACLEISDLTGGTPTLKHGINWDDFKNYKDRGSQAISMAYLFFNTNDDNTHEYAVCTAWNYDGYNGANEYYFYFDDIEFGGSTRYRAVYKYDETQPDNQRWSVVYWDTYANYIANL